MKLDGFVFYRSWYESIKALKEQDEIFCETIRVILEYGLYGKTPKKISPMATAFFTMIKPQIDANTKRYLAGRKNGHLGGNPNFKKGQRNPYYPKKDSPNDTKSTELSPELSDELSPELSLQSGENQTDSTKKDNPKDNPNITLNSNINNNINSNINNNINNNDNIKLPQSKIAIKTKEERKLEFKNLLLNSEFGYAEKYGTDMLADFFNYWTESNPNGKKMRWEMQQVFDVSRRLATWAKNCKNKSNFNNGNNRTNYQTAAERGREQLAGVASKILAKYR